MQKSIVLGGRIIEYTLTYKKIKNINIRVKSDLSVCVSAPNKISESQITDFIIRSQNFILSAISKYQKRPPKQELKLFSGEKIFYLGEQKSLLVLEGKSGVYINSDTIVLRVENPQDFTLKQRVLTKWLNQQCKAVVLGLCQKAYERFKGELKAFPEIKFRNMRSGWGNCRPAKNRLTFAYMLVNAPLECINYVVYHEFTHFLEFNHSPKFYAKLSLFLPNWKELKTKLRNYQ